MRGLERVGYRLLLLALVLLLGLAARFEVRGQTTYTITPQIFLGEDANADAGTLKFFNTKDDALGMQVKGDTEITDLAAVVAGDVWVEAKPSDEQKYELERIMYAFDGETTLHEIAKEGGKLTVIANVTARATFQKHESGGGSSGSLVKFVVQIATSSDFLITVTQDGAPVASGEVEWALGTVIRVEAVSRREGYRVKRIRINGLAYSVPCTYTVQKGLGKTLSITAEIAQDNLTDASSEALRGVQAGPNPFSGAIQVTNAEGVVSYALLNITGARVREGRHNGTPQLTLETGSLPKGIYLLRLISAKGERVLRLMKY